MASTAQPAIERVLFTEEQVAARIREVAAEISEKYRGRELKLIAVLKGAVFFPDRTGARDRDSGEDRFSGHFEFPRQRARNGTHRERSG